MPTLHLRLITNETSVDLSTALRQTVDNLVLKNYSYVAIIPSTQQGVGVELDWTNVGVFNTDSGVGAAHRMYLPIAHGSNSTIHQMNLELENTSGYLPRKFTVKLFNSAGLPFSAPGENYELNLWFNYTVRY